MGKERISIVGKVVLKDEGPNLIMTCPSAKLYIKRKKTTPYSDFVALQQSEPIQLIEFSENFWLFRNRLIGTEGEPDEELQLRIKHKVLSEERNLAKIKREVEALENVEKVLSSQRARIPKDVRLFVWQRDEGKCVECGSREKLEFDHIIPVSKGGGNTDRNIQLMCEPCNRSKGDAL